MIEISLILIAILFIWCCLKISGDKQMKNFEELTEEEQNEAILNISGKLDKQEIWYWEGLVHKLREYEKFIDDDLEVRKGLVDRIKRQQERIDKAVEFIEEHNIIGTSKEYLPSGIEKCYSLELMEILKGSDK